jgi:hypothetical protein
MRRQLWLQQRLRIILLQDAKVQDAKVQMPKVQVA